MRILLVVAALASAAAAKPPPAPSIGRADGKALVALARAAMRDYLTSRTNSDDYRLPTAVRPLASHPHAAAVTLRLRGSVLARHVRGDGALPRNVVAAALQAMRTPTLPDRITAADLADLTVEVEILGDARTMSPEALPKQFVPGLTGLTLTRPSRSVHTLPSTAIVLGLSLEAMQRDCRARAPGSPPSPPPPDEKWSLFATRHYVGFPDGTVVWLLRGKMLLPHEAVSEAMLSAAAERVGECLLRNQRKTGTYDVGSDRASLPDRLYATCAMARLAKRTGRQDFAASVNASLAYAGRLVKAADGRAWIETGGSEDLAATALLAMAVADAPGPKSPEASRLHEALLGTLRRGAKAPPDDKLNRTARAMALLALFQTTADPLDTDLQAAIERLVPATKQQSHPGRTPPSDVTEAAWLVRAITAGQFGPKGTYAMLTNQLCREMASSARGADAPADEYGGVSEGSEPPSTAATALATVATMEAAAHWNFRTIEPERRARADALQMRRFCYQMIYKAPEVYFAETPAAWIGSVRRSPASADVSLRACAAAIEAFLAGSR